MSWIKDNINEDVADYLFNIRLDCLPKRIGVYQRDVRPDLAINWEMIEEELETTPEMMAFWDQLLAEQKSKVAVLLRKKDVTRGFVRRTMINEARDNKVSIRLEDLKDIINADENMVKLDKEIIVETRKEDKVRAVVFALRMKSEHLRSLAGFKKEEKRQIR